jgi:hypothetical protein
MSHKRISFVLKAARPVSIRPEVQKVIDEICSIDDHYEFSFEYDENGQLVEPTDAQLLELEQARNLLAEADTFYRCHTG